MSRANKVVMMKKIGGEQINLYPKSSADNIVYDSTSTVKDILDALILEIQNLENVLSINSLYVRDGQTLLNDGNGNNLVAVASLVSDIDENAEGNGEEEEETEPTSE